ncbi:MAG: hypothetical protein IJE66_07600 [Akkermansia sp.]|nr:hypothetical protein [Akkermansia sp.]
MKHFLAGVLLLVPVVAAQQESVTLDPEAMAEVWREVAGAPSVKTPAAPVLDLTGRKDAAPDASAAALWREAAGEVNSPAFPVLVLSLLQSLNPQLPMERNVWAYAAALELHRRAFSANPRACAELAAALRSGTLAGLTYFVDAGLAAELEGKTRAVTGEGGGQ